MKNEAIGIGSHMFKKPLYASHSCTFHWWFTWKGWCFYKSNSVSRDWYDSWTKRYFKSRIHVNSVEIKCNMNKVFPLSKYYVIRTRFHNHGDPQQNYTTYPNNHQNLTIIMLHLHMKCQMRKASQHHFIYTPVNVEC